MSKYDKASLVQIPSGYKANKLYSVLPVNGDGDFTFARTSTGTRVNKDGYIETVATGEPRLDYPLIDGVVQDCPALLLEPSRSNLVPYSEAFDEPDWVKNSSTVTSNQVISPDGTLNADLLETSVAGGGVADAISGSGDYSFSVFAKYKDIQFIRLRSTNSYAWFDIKNGSVGTTISALDAKIEYYGNGWYRCTLVGNNTNTIFQITCTEQNSLNVGFGGVYLWGAQLEEGSYPTSYIPTAGSAVTRSAETCNSAGNASTFNDSEGVLYAEIAALAGDDFSTSRRIGITKNGTYEGVRIQLGDNNISATVYDGTTNQYSKSISYNNETPNKIALKYKENDFSVWINGIEYEPQSSGSTFVDGTLNDLSFNYVGGAHFYGKAKEIATFKEALTDSELEALTSWDSFNDMAKEQLYTIE